MSKLSYCKISTKSCETPNVFGPPNNRQTHPGTKRRRDGAPFFHSPEEPVRCALEISRTLQEHPHIQLRMGVHSGPVNQVTDVNDKTNIAGAGINVAQRVMDCGDAGHILLSGHIAEDLTHYRHWQPYLHDLGECEVKHG